MAMTETDVPTAPDESRIAAAPTGWLAGLAATVGLGALAASSCCVLPLALAGLGASGAVFSAFESLVGMRPYLLGGAALALVAAWAVFLRRRRLACDANGACVAPATSTRNVALLGLGTFVVALSFAWGAFIEPVLLSAVQ
jgi:mercuric ion transport protein